MKTLETHPKSSSGDMQWSTSRNSTSPFDRLCKRGETLFPNHCWQTLTCVLVERFH